MLKPDCLLPTAEPISLWFSDLLTLLGDKFDTLAKAAYELDDWAAHAKIMCYGCIDTKCHEIELELTILQGCLALNNEALDRCWYCIEVSRVPHQLRNLQGWSHFPLHHGEQIGRCAGGCPRGTRPGVPV